MKAERVVRGCFALSLAASVGLSLVYLAGGSRAWEGVLLAAALGGIGVGFILWATRLIDAPDNVEERREQKPGEGLGLISEVLEQSVTGVSRRKVLAGLASGAAASLGAALAIPSLSLGPQPGRSLFRTLWVPGIPAVDSEGARLRPEDVPLSGIITVFPQGSEGAGDSQAVLLRVAPDLLSLPEARASWAPQGCLAYSKICTHAGCPVGLYRAQARELLCPCHQSTFDVLTGAAPVFGPAVRPLPQLPLAVDEDGYLVAQGDFSGPVGPSFWNVTQ